MRKNTLLKVEWSDIQAESAWLTEEKALATEVAKCTSVGFLLSKTETELRMSSTICCDGGRDVLVIPTGCIQKITRLK